MIGIEQIIIRCKENDAKAQFHLYDCYKSKLMGICRRYSASREEAQDVLQETFVKIFSKIKTLESAERLESWMTRIAINTAINFYHRSKSKLFVDVDTVQADSGDYEIILSGLSDEHIVQCINSLPDGCRLVFNLFIVEGYSHSEIGKLLNISESTSRSQLLYARNVLKEKLNSLGFVKYERLA